MADHSVQLGMRTRPIRFAFFVSPSDRSSFRRVVQACSIRWGGMLSPIIPAFRRLPAWAKEPYWPMLSAKEMAQGYLESFQPDYVVDCETGIPGSLGLPDSLVLPFEEFEKPDWRSAVAPGVGAYEVYRYAFQTQLQFVQRKTRPWVLPSTKASSGSTFCSTVLGDLPEDGPFSYVRRAYRDVFDPDEVEPSPAECSALAIGRDAGTPIVASMQHIRRRDFQTRTRLPLVMDPSSILDLIDFWNLRAYGMMPISIPLGDWDDPIDRLCEIDTHDLRSSDSDIATIARTPRVDPEAVEDVISKLDASGFDGELSQSMFGSLPPLWQPNRLRLNRHSRSKVMSSETKIERSIEDDRITFDPPIPDFIDEENLTMDSSWAVEVDLDFGFPGEYPDFVPGSLTDVTQMLRAFGRDLVTTSREGLVIRCSGLHSRQFWTLPDGFSVFQNWFKDLGVDIRPSPAGRTSSELIRQLGGPLQSAMLTSVALIHELGRSSGGGRATTYSRMVEVLKKQQGTKERAVRQLEHLTRLDVVRPLVRIRCARCDFANEFEPRDLQPELECARCLRSFPFPASEPPHRSDWVYRPAGPFSVPGYADGAYTVALTLRFLLLNPMSGNSAWTSGFESQDATPFELDFGVWNYDPNHPEREAQLYLGEAKTFSEFETRDFARARQILSKFPKANFVFSCLRSELTVREKREIQKLAVGGRNKFPGHHPNRGRIIILTELELADTLASTRMGWRKSGGRHEELADLMNRGVFSDQISEASLELYADHKYPSSTSQR